MKVIYRVELCPKCCLRFKRVQPLALEAMIVMIKVDNHMAMLEVYIGKNLVDVTMLDGGSSVNVIIERLRNHLGLLPPKSTLIHVKMANYSMNQPLGVVRNLE